MHTKLRFDAYKLFFLLPSAFCALAQKSETTLYPILAFVKMHFSVRCFLLSTGFASNFCSRCPTPCVALLLPIASLPFGVLSGAVHPSLHCHSERCRVPFTHRFTAVRDTVGCRSPIASLPFGVLSGCRSPTASLPFGRLSDCLKIGCQVAFYHPKKPSSYPSKSIRRGQKRHPATRHPAYQNRSILFHSLLLPLGARLHKRENRAVRFVGSFFLCPHR